MGASLQALKASRDTLYPTCPWVFQRKGEQFQFRHKTWNKLVSDLGASVLFHDLRRTAATNMIEAGYSEKEAMEITGHKTDKMFRRYQIVRRHRIHALGQGMAKYLEKLENGAKEQEKAGSSPGILSGIEEPALPVN